MRKCWEIRQAISDKTEGNGWTVSCAECAMFGGEASCWEQCNGSPCCCAPIHVTCDFCVLYIEHRRELAELLHAGEPIPSPTGTPHPAEVARLPIHAKGEPPAIMEKLQLSVPDMWADHHVLKARAVLSALPGVQQVIASSSFRIVALTYDPAVTNPGVIMATLEDAGYAVATNGTGVIAKSVPVADGKSDAAWTHLGMRQSMTDERDLKTKR